MAVTTNFRAFLEELAPLSEEARRSRLDELFRGIAFEDANRGPVLAQLIEACSTVSPDVRKKYLRSRTAVLCDVPMNALMAVTGTYREIILTIPREQAEVEIGELKALMPEMDRKNRQMAERFIHFLPPRDSATVGSTVAGTDAPELRERRKWYQRWRRP
ncbi:MAG: hypothetical protein HY682_02475 [Chloroflexi bacterium]|nr:hypothetical protein [Chloroflexota bacterium]